LALDIVGFREWLERYFRAWVSNDATDVNALFTEDAIYWFDPFQAPRRGRDAIVESWLSGPRKMSSRRINRTFTRAAALGAHRSRAHGVAGRSAQAAKRRTSSERAASATRGSAARTRSVAAAKPRSEGKASTGASTRARALPRRNGIDRDALLKTLFPDGMPAREEVIRAASGWLDNAERFSRMR
jgi:ketosteroid isomerase-like protein